MRLLDLYCGAGVGITGFEEWFDTIIGVDIHEQPEYPYTFWQADALDLLDIESHGHVGDFHLVWASPPCQLHTRAGKLRDAQGGTSRYEDLLTPTLEIVRTLDMPWIVENVPDAKPLMAPRDGEHLVMLCGSMFGLKVQRHRWFLSNMPISAPGPCDHSTFESDPITGKPRPWGVYHVVGDSIPKGGRTVRTVEHGHEVMGMTRRVKWESLKEGIPPAYTEWLGRQLAAALTGVRH